VKNNGKHRRDTEQIILVHNVNRKINTVTFYYRVRAYHRPSTILTAVVQNSGETSTTYDEPTRFNFNRPMGQHKGSQLITIAERKHQDGKERVGLDTRHQLIG